MTRELSFPLLRRDDRGDPPGFQPAEHPAKLGPEDCLVRKTVEQTVDGVQCDALRLHPVDERPQAEEQSLQVVLPGFLDLAPFDPHLLHREKPASTQVTQIDPQARDVRRQVPDGLFEGDKDSRLSEVEDPACNELHGKKRLAAAGPTAHEGRPSPRKPPLRDLIEPADAGGALSDALLTHSGGTGLRHALTPFLTGTV